MFRIFFFGIFLIINFFCILVTSLKIRSVLFYYLVSQSLNIMKIVNIHLFIGYCDIIYNRCIRSAKTGAREKSINNLYFISDSPLKFIDRSVFKGDQIRLSTKQ